MQKVPQPHPQCTLIYTYTSTQLLQAFPRSMRAPHSLCSTVGSAIHFSLTCGTASSWLLRGSTTYTTVGVSSTTSYPLLHHAIITIDLHIQSPSIQSPSVITLHTTPYAPDFWQPDGSTTSSQLHLLRNSLHILCAHAPCNSEIQNFLCTANSLTRNVVYSELLPS